MRVLAYCGLLGLLLLISASTCSRKLVNPRSEDLDKPKGASLCELIAKPEQYRNQTVQIEAVFYSDRENTALYSPQCGDAEKNVWADFEPGFQYEDASVKRRFNDTGCQRQPCLSAETRVTLVGRFEGPADRGYGHLGGYRYRFLIKRILAAEKLP